ncbi:uncharacterized protein F5891DRAFT_961711, partial [Suillus fuscotomentosus]
MDTSLADRLDNVLACMEENFLTPADFINHILGSTEHESARNSLTTKAVRICAALYREEHAHSHVTQWAITIVRDMLRTERDLGEFGGDDIGGMMREEDDVNEEADDEQSGKRQRRAAERNAALLVIRTVVMISICLQTSNSQCNLLQGWLGFFMRSACVPEKVVEVFAHAGLSISLTSIHNAVSSISREISSKIKREVRTLQAGFAYDNFDIQFKAAQPMLEHRGSFVSATSATVIPLYGINDDNVDALRSSAQLWDQDSHNPSPSVLPVMTEWRSFLQLHKNDAYSRQTHPVRLSPRQEAFSWHVRAILVNQVKEFKHFKKELDEPDTVKRIPVHKTNQIPCRAMDIKQSTTDGNVEVLDNLFRQGGIGDPRDSGFDVEHDVDMSEHIMLIHGDLLTKERLDTVRNSRCIEHTPKNRFQYVIFLPGLFHYKMACTDAI